jgi:osmotically-inducible protein OsmY
MASSCATNQAQKKLTDMPAEPGGAGAAARAESKPLTDPQLVGAIEHTFRTDAALHNATIEVKVTEGIVTLVGTVDNLLGKERATKLGETIRGVRGVVNTLMLRTLSRPDEDVRKDVEAALSYDAATHAYHVTPEVKNGVVTLTGTVGSYRERLLAEYVTKGVKGVSGVEDAIALTSKVARPDAQLETEIKRAMSIDVWLHSTAITTAVKDGAVTLTGTVASPAQYDRANLLAWTSGVRSVNASALKIDPSAKAMDQRSETVSMKDDSQIKQAVSDGLLVDARVAFFSPHVEVVKGVVTLTGVVDNRAAKRAAAQDAKNTWGVARVKDFLTVRPVNVVADDLLASNISAAIQRDPVLDGYAVAVQAKNGIVVLTGVVDSTYEKSQAEDIASRLIGVIDVKNQLTISYPSLYYYDIANDPYWSSLPSYSYGDTYRAPYYRWTYPGQWWRPDDLAMKSDIEEQLRWSPWTDTGDITVKVADGVATLTGKVDNWFDYNSATESAYHAGAQQVYNMTTLR